MANCFIIAKHYVRMYMSERDRYSQPDCLNFCIRMFRQRTPNYTIADIEKNVEKAMDYFASRDGIENWTQNDLNPQVQEMSMVELVGELILRIVETNGLEFVHDADLMHLFLYLKSERDSRGLKDENFQ